MTQLFWKTPLKALALVVLGALISGCNGEKKNTTPDDPKPQKTGTVTISDVLKADVGSSFSNIDCVTIVATNEQGVILQEDGSSIYAYLGESHEFTVGDMVTVVSGTTTTRNGLYQFGKGVQLEKTWHGDFTQPTPSTFAGSDVDAYMKAPEIKYVTYTGTVIVAGNYVNVEIDGTDNIGSLDYMSDEFKEKYNRHSLTITGWLFGSYKTYMYTVPVEVVDNGIHEEVIPEGAIYYNTFDKEIATQDSEKYGTTKGWPWLDQFDGWKNEKGTGASAVEYDYKEMSVRTNQESKGSLSTYEGSGNNNIFFGGSTENPNWFTIGKIAVPSQNLRLSFGAQYYSQGSANTFIKSNFTVQLSADGSTWSPALDYDFGGVEDTHEGKWRLAVADFTLPAGTNTLYIKFAAKSFSVNRLDDVLLVEGNGGQQVEFGKDVETPLSTISEVLASPVDETYKIQGTVMAIHTKGFLVKDDTGSILVFMKGHTMTAGDNVTVEGPTTEYGGMKQFDGTSVVTVSSHSDVTYPTPEEFKAAQFNSYVDNLTVKYVTYTGTLKSTQDQIYQWHYNVTVDGTDVQGTISYPESRFNISKYDGVKIIVCGYLLGVTESDGVKYVTTMATSIEPVDKETKPEEKDAITVAELNKKLADFKSGDMLTSVVAVKGYVAANNEGGNLKSVISLVDNTGAEDSGIIIKGTDYTESTLPVGTKVIVSLQTAKYTVSNNLPTITNATIYPTEEKATMTVPEIADNELSKYVGQYVKVKDVTSPEASSTWYSTDFKSGHSFTGKNNEVVTVYVVKAAKFANDSFAANTTGDILGVVEWYKDKIEIIPTSSADVAAFAK